MPHLEECLDVVPQDEGHVCFVKTMQYLLSGDAAEGVLYIESDSLRPSFCTGVRPKCNLAIFEAWILLSSSLCIAVIIVPRWRPACIYRSSFGIRTRRKAYRSRYSRLCAESSISLKACAGTLASHYPGAGPST